MTLQLVKKEAENIRKAVSLGSEVIFFIGGTFVDPAIIEEYKASIGPRLSEAMGGLDTSAW